MTDRIPLDDMTSDQLDQLYYRLDQARDAVALHRQGLLTTAELYAVIEADAAPVPPAPEPDPAVAQEAIRQMDADPHGLEAGMIVKAYRDHGAEKWVFRCWGTDTCDGALSLDHYSQQSAERARDRHVAEQHPAEPVPCPACRRADQAGLAPGELHHDCAKEQR
jgi:hypothetical protein